MKHEVEYFPSGHGKACLNLRDPIARQPRRRREPVDLAHRVRVLL